MVRANGTVVSYDMKTGKVVIKSDRSGDLYETSLEKTHDFFEPTKIGSHMKDIGKPIVGEPIAFVLNPLDVKEVGWWGSSDSTISG